MDSFAFYRLPEQWEYVRMKQTTGSPRTIGSVAELGGRRGFVMAPFAASEGCPIVLLEPDEVSVCPVGDDVEAHIEDCPVREDAERACYQADFARFHARLKSGEFRKIVLARCSEVSLRGPVDTESLFLHACHLYPHQMIALFSSPLTGTWLMATPEVLLDGDGCRWRTMALAGTMKTDGPWSEKNREEQRYVAGYIMDCLTRYGENVSRSATYTRSAARLCHLCTDFEFDLAPGCRVGDLLDALYPTPAVCGIPKEETRRYILDNEHTPRLYYSGFLGPLDPVGETHLFVSLRCMKIGAGLQLYAGGGLLIDSREEREWEETEDKLNTMRHVFE